MATPESPSPLPISRRQAKEQKLAMAEELAAESRVARMRERRDRSTERKFTALFIFAVSILTLYLVSRTPWGMHLIGRYF